MLLEIWNIHFMLMAKILLFYEHFNNNQPINLPHIFLTMVRISKN